MKGQDLGKSITILEVASRKYKHKTLLTKDTMICILNIGNTENASKGPDSVQINVDLLL